MTSIIHDRDGIVTVTQVNFSARGNVLVSERTERDPPQWRPQTDAEVVADQTPASTHYIVVDDADLPRAPVEQWVVDWQTGAITVDPRLGLTAADYKAAIQDKIDAVARAKNYRDGFAAATYVTSAVFGAEAQVFVNWRDGVWVYAYAQLDLVLTGQRTQPSIEDFIAEIEAQHPAPWPV